MTEVKMTQQSKASKKTTSHNVALLLGTGLSVTSIILVPALAVRLKLGARLTGALRINPD